MNRVLVVLAMILLVAIQVAGWPELTTRVLPAFCLAGALAWGIVGGRLAGFRAAIIFGLILDLYSQHNFGMFTTAMALAAAVPALFARDEDSGLATQLAALATAAVTYELVILTWISLADDRAAFLANLVTVGTLNSIGTVVVGLLLTLALTAFGTGTRTHDQRSIRL
jgi:rod shape-determining protein MreD